MSTLAAAQPQALSALDDEELAFNTRDARSLRELSARRLWSFNDAELAAIQAHFKAAKREPTLAEIETLAQTWSEHCKHKVFNGRIRYSGPAGCGSSKKTSMIKSLFEETIVKATKRVQKPWCLSVFKDNAGVVSMGPGSRWALAFKVETHNHPCAIEPYGGAETGVGGVIRDVLGVGLGAKPVLGTDVFCLAPPSYAGALPEGTLAPARTLRGVVAGVRDYGNRMGIPTAGGGMWFDEGFRLNPLVFVGTVGVLPASAVKKEVKPGDLIVAAGGRTGRDGLHGATFSSAALGEDAPASAVQIGHALNEKRLLDALMAARDQRLYRSLTDCGAGGFSSAIGEMAASGGALVRLEEAPLKASDLQPWEIWLSESQERMILAVPPKNLKALQEVFAATGCETAVLGQFTRTGRLVVKHHEETVVDLDVKFLHKGLPKVERAAVWEAPKSAAAKTPSPKRKPAETLRLALSHLNVCSREWIIRQYDHEVQAGTIIKPLQGVRHDGPGDACVIWPQAATLDWASHAGFAVSHGLNPSYGKADPYRMALACADEALRNLLCVGADVSRAAFLDNFCWGSPDEPSRLGALVRAAQGCHDAAVGFGVPFISGKDSFHNQSRDVDGRQLAVPGTLLISALAPVLDVRKALTMDVKGPGNGLYLVGSTSEELGGSLYAELEGFSGGAIPQVDPRTALQSFRAVQAAIAKGLVLSAHDLSEGGLAVAVAEMCFSGEFGATIDLDEVPHKGSIYSNEVLLFSESQSRLLLEVGPEKEAAFLRLAKGCARRIGATVANPVLKVIGLDGIVALEEPLSALKTAWQAPLPEALR